MKKIIIFAAGVAIGTGIGILIANKVYGKKIKAHINKITEGINKKVPKKKLTVPKEVEKAASTDILVGASEKAEKVDTLKTMYDRIVKQETYSYVGLQSKKRIHKIDPDEFGNDPAYSTESLRYFPETDELIDQKNGEHVEVSTTIGYENLKDLSAQDPYTTFYYRNEDAMVDFDVEIGEIDE